MTGRLLPGGPTYGTRTHTRSLEGCCATVTPTLDIDSAPEGLRVHPTVLSTKIAAGSYPDHSNVDIANRVKLAECGGIAPPRRCRRPRFSKPAPYLSGNTPYGGSKKQHRCGHRYLGNSPPCFVLAPFCRHGCAMDAAAYRRRAMELAPTRGLEPLSTEGRRFSGPLQ